MFKENRFIYQKKKEPLDTFGGKKKLIKTPEGKFKLVKSGSFAAIAAGEGAVQGVDPVEARNKWIREERERRGVGAKEMAEKGVKLVDGQLTAIPADEDAATETPVEEDPGETEGPVEQLPTMTEEEETRALAEQEQFADVADVGEELFPGQGVVDLSLEEFLQRLKDTHAQQLRHAERQAVIAEELEASQLETAETQAEAAKAGAVATFAQDREGPVSAGAPLVVQEFQIAVNKRINEAELRIQSAQNERGQALVNMKEAQRQGKEDVVRKWKGILASTESKIRQEQIAKMDSMARLADFEIKLQEQELRTADQQLRAENQTNLTTAAKIEVMESMGVSIGDLSIAQLSTMIQDTNLTMPEALSLQKAIELEGLALETKDEAEAEKMKLEAQKLRADIAEIGKLKPTTAQQNFDVLQGLSEAGFDDEAVLDFKRLIGIAPEELTALDKLKLAQGYAVLNDSLGVQGASGDVASQILNASSAQGFHGGHQALDYTLAGGTNADVRVPVTGSVVDVRSDGGWNGGFGNTVVIDVGGETHRFAHLSSIDPNIKVGSVITSGQTIGKQGNTGNTRGATGIHVHYEITGKDGKRINPQEFLGAIKESANDIYSEQQKEVLNSLSGIPVEDLDATSIKILDAAGLTTTDLLAFKVTPAPVELTELGKSALGTARQLMEKFQAGDGTSAVGMSRIFLFQHLPGTPPRVFANKFDTLKSQLSLEAIKYLKGQGQVSDAERRILAEAVSELNLSQTESAFEESLQQIIDKLSAGETPDVGDFDADAAYEDSVLDVVSGIDSASLDEISAIWAD